MTFSSPSLWWWKSLWGHCFLFSWSLASCVSEGISEATWTMYPWWRQTVVSHHHGSSRKQNWICYREAWLKAGRALARVDFWPLGSPTDITAPTEPTGREGASSAKGATCACYPMSKPMTAHSPHDPGLLCSLPPKPQSLCPHSKPRVQEPQGGRTGPQRQMGII